MRPVSFSKSRGFAMIEPLVAVTIVMIVASSTLYALFSANRYATQQRYVSAAKAACQERIDQALTRPFTSSSVPSFLGGTWPLPATETLTATETVPIYVPQESGSPALVNGTRRTYVTRYSPVAASPQFVFARVRVRVEFWSQGRGVQNRKSTDAGAQPFSFEMTTLRSPD